MSARKKRGQGERVERRSVRVTHEFVCCALAAFDVLLFVPYQLVTYLELSLPFQLLTPNPRVPLLYMLNFDPRRLDFDFASGHPGL